MNAPRAAPAAIVFVEQLGERGQHLVPDQSLDEVGERIGVADVTREDDHRTRAARLGWTSQSEMPAATGPTIWARSACRPSRTLTAEVIPPLERSTPKASREPADDAREPVGDAHAGARPERVGLDRAGGSHDCQPLALEQPRACSTAASIAAPALPRPVPPRRARPGSRVARR